MEKESADAKAGARSLLEQGWLSRTPHAFQRAMLDLAVWRRAAPGESIIVAGDSGGMCGIARGSVELSSGIGPADGPGIHLAHAGFWAGYRPLLMDMPRRLTIVARTEVVWALVPQAALAAMLAEHPAWWRHIGELAEETGMLATYALADMSLQDSSRRAIAVLLRFGGCRFSDPPGEEPVEVRISHGELASMAGMSRNTLSEILSRQAATGRIEIGYRSIIVRQPAVLRAVADHGAGE